MGVGAIIGGIGALAGAAGTLFGGGGTLAPRNLYNEAQQTIRARTQYDDQLFALNQLDAQRQAGVNNNTLAQTLFGQPGGPQSVNSYDLVPSGLHAFADGEAPAGASLYKSNAVGANTGQGPGQAPAGKRWYYVPPNTYRTSQKTVNTQASRGQLDILGEAAPQYARIQADALKAGDPNGYALHQQILQDASSQLAHGPNAGDTGRDTEAIRNALLSRGLGYGAGGAVREAVSSDRATQERRNQIQQYALAASAAGSGANYNPSNLLSSAFGIGSNNQQNFDPLNGYANDAYGTNYNAAAASNIAQRNALGAIGGSILNLGGRYAINNQTNRPPVSGGGGGSGQAESLAYGGF